MRKAYRITGSSFEHPGTLPDGLSVKERLVGEALGTKELVFHEVKDGSVVVYRQGVAGSNVKLSPEEVRDVMNFLWRVDAETRRNAVKALNSKCPGIPHEGDSASDWSCPDDRA